MENKNKVENTVVLLTIEEFKKNKNSPSDRLELEKGLFLYGDGAIKDTIENEYRDKNLYEYGFYHNQKFEYSYKEVRKPINGGKNTYYDIDVSDLDTIDVDDISERYGFNPYEFNIFKALVGTANQRNYGKARHKAAEDKLRDYNKIVWYANKNLLYGMKIYGQ